MRIKSRRAVEPVSGERQRSGWRAMACGSRMGAVGSSGAGTGSPPRGCDQEGGVSCPLAACGHSTLLRLLCIGVGAHPRPRGDARIAGCRRRRPLLRPAAACPVAAPRSHPPALPGTQVTLQTAHNPNMLRMPVCRSPAACRRRAPHPPPTPQPEAVRAAIQEIVRQPLDRLGEALQGFTWEFESKVGVWLGPCIVCGEACAAAPCASSGSVPPRRVAYPRTGQRPWRRMPARGPSLAFAHVCATLLPLRCTPLGLAAAACRRCCVCCTAVAGAAAGHRCRATHSCLPSPTPAAAARP